MTPMEERVRQLFGESIETQIAAADSMSETIAQAGTRLADCLLNEGKILICGNGGSAANAFHFSSALINHFGAERPALPVINLACDVASLTSIGNDSQYEQIFSRQIQALGGSNDVLLVLTTAVRSNSILQAVHAANERGMDTIVLCGRDGGILLNHLGPEDIALRTLADTAARIREIHLFILHCFCSLIDQQIFGH